MFQHPGYSQSLQIKDIPIIVICTYGRHVYRTVWTGVCLKSVASWIKREKVSQTSPDSSGVEESPLSVPPEGYLQQHHPHKV
jgi:hypothetical protein